MLRMGQRVRQRWEGNTAKQQHSSEGGEFDLDDLHCLKHSLREQQDVCSRAKREGLKRPLRNDIDSMGGNGTRRF